MARSCSVVVVLVALFICIVTTGVAFSPSKFTVQRLLVRHQLVKKALFQPEKFQLRTELSSTDSANIAATNTPEIVMQPAGSIQHQIEQIINTNLLKSELRLHTLKWRPGALDLSLAKANTTDDSSPQLDQLEAFHKQLYTELEADPVINQFLEKCDIMISTPGLSDVLSSDRDFVTFQGFSVNVQTTEEFRQVTTLSGTLVKRTSDSVVLSQKGKMVSVPRRTVKEVRLPPALREPGDLGY